MQEIASGRRTGEKLWLYPVHFPFQDSLSGPVRHWILGKIDLWFEPINGSTCVILEELW